MAGHRPIGSRHGMAKLTDADVANIKALLTERKRLQKLLEELSPRAIGAKFEVCADVIRRIDRGDNWAHVAAAEPRREQP
jgi:hypothetical protein